MSTIISSLLNQSVIVMRPILSMEVKGVINQLEYATANLTLILSRNAKFVKRGGSLITASAMVSIPYFCYI